MTHSSLASRGLSALLPRPLLAALDAWSHRVAQARAARRRQSGRALSPAAAAAQPRWPTSWGD